MTAENGSYWEVSMDVLERYGLHAQGASLKGRISPICPVNVEKAQREALAIPEDAKQLAWAYPVADWEQVEDMGMARTPSSVKGSEAVESFLSVGGFMYFDTNGDVVGVTTLGTVEEGDEQPADCHFGKPRKWQKEWTAALVAQGRFQAVTIKALSDIGAKHFCWIRPSEIIRGSDGKPLAAQPMLALGGFAYLFHENPLTKKQHRLASDCYFPIKAIAVSQPRRQSEFQQHELKLLEAHSGGRGHRASV
jgi:hypothetical protein